MRKCRNADAHRSGNTCAMLYPLTAVTIASAWMPQPWRLLMREYRYILSILPGLLWDLLAWSKMCILYPGRNCLVWREQQFIFSFQADGGNYCACVNAATLALIDAGIPLKDYVTACTASLVLDTPLVDISSLEATTGWQSFNLCAFLSF